MKDVIFNQENVDAYVLHKMSGEERSRFETALEKDPSLQNEIGLQRDIAESLQSARRLELKARMNAISTTSAVSSGVVKLVAAFAAAALIGTASLYFFSKKDTATASVSKNPAQETASDQVIFSASANEANNSGENKGNTNTETVKNLTQTIVQAGQNKTAAQNKENNTSSSASPVIIEPGQNGNDQSGDALTTGNASASDLKAFADKAPVNYNWKAVSVNKKGFSYEFKNNQLLIYGDFKDKSMSPYEVQEFNTRDGKKSIYFHVNNTWYEIDPSNTKQTRMEEVKNQQTIMELNKVRVKN